MLSYDIFARDNIFVAGCDPDSCFPDEKECIPDCFPEDSDDEPDICAPDCDPNW